MGIVFSLNLVMTKYVEGKIIGKNYPASTHNKHFFLLGLPVAVIVPPLVRTMMVYLTLLEAIVEFILEVYLFL